MGVAHHVSLYDDVTQFSTLSFNINAAFIIYYVMFSSPEIKNMILFYKCILLAQSL